MTSTATVHRWLRRIFCGVDQLQPQSPVVDSVVPFQVREASHRLANAATAAQGAARNLEKNSLVLRALAESIKSR